MNIRHISAVATLAIFLPFAASALTVEEIQLQISNLLSQITQLQQQLTQTQAQTQIACTADAKICPDGSAVGRSGPNCEFAACPGTTTPPATACPVFTRTLYRGISGTDVASLQASLGVSQTGYYGPMTEAAVQQMQVQEGIVSSGTAATTGYGAVGPQTRTAFLRRCGGGGGTSQSFSASPTFGSAPLTVVFRTDVMNNLDAYFIDFGDVAYDATGRFQNNCQYGYGACGQATASHTYTSNGTYTAKLIYQPEYYCPPGAMCPAVMPVQKIIGTAVITVGGTTSTGVPSISGLDAPTSLTVGQTGTWTVRATAPAGTQLSYSVQWGDEMMYSMPMTSSTAGNVAVSGTFTHAYAQAGTYKPVFTVSNSSGSAQTSASVTIGNSTNGRCVVGGCSGQVCGEEGFGLITTCEYRSQYACYQTARCERQASGQCGWTQTSELQACLSANN